MAASRKRKRHSATNSESQELPSLVTHSVPTSDHEAVPEGLVSSLEEGRNEATYSRAKKTYRMTVTLESTSPFTVVPTILHEGLFKGRRVYMVNEGHPCESRSLLMDLPPELRTKVIGLASWDFAQEVFLDGTRDYNLKPYVMTEVRKLWGYKQKRLMLSKPNLSLLLTSRQLHQEAAPIFYGNAKFRFDSAKVLLNFLTRIGSCVVYLRHIHLSNYTTRELQRCTTKLLEAKDLRDFRVKIVTWVDHKHHAWMPGAHLTNEPHLSTYHPLVTFAAQRSALRDMFEEYAKTKTVDEIFSIIRFDEDERFLGKCTCQNGKTVNGTDCSCEEAYEAYQEWLSNIKFDFVAWRKAEAEKDSKSKRIKGKGGDDDLDDDLFTHEPAPAPQRRDTGRPKRRVTQEHAVSYAE